MHNPGHSNLGIFRLVFFPHEDDDRNNLDVNGFYSAYKQNHSATECIENRQRKKKVFCQKNVPVENKMRIWLSNLEKQKSGIRKIWL